MKHIELFKDGFDSTVQEKIQPENWPYVARDIVTGEIVYTLVPEPQPNNEIWYTTSDGNVVNLYRINGFGANIISNTYEDGKGVIKFDNSVTSIGWETFAYNCRLLTSIAIPNSVTSIAKGAFIGCASLSAINIPENVTSIGDGAFNSCTSFTSITIPNGISSIGNGLFYGCISLKSITIPNSVTSIGSSAFRNCGLTSITIPNGVTSIEDHTFYDCDELTSVNIEGDITNIGKNAFAGCTSLTSIIISNSVTSIGSRAFYWCTSLAYITFKGTMEEWNRVSKDSSWNSEVPATYVQCSDGQVKI